MGFIQKCTHYVYKYLKCVEIQWMGLIVFAWSEKIKTLYNYCNIISI